MKTFQTFGAKKDQQEKGYVLMGAYLVIMILSALSLAFFSRGHQFVQVTERNQNRVVALNMADSGLHDAMRKIAADTDYAGTGSYTAFDTQGGYQTAVCPPACPAGLEEPDSSEIRGIQAIGYAPSNVTTARAYESRPVTAYVELDGTPFEFAAFGDDSLGINGSPLINSYNSNDGAYGGGNIKSNGDLASDGPMTFVGNPTIDGDVIENPKYNCSPASTNIPSSGPLKIKGSTVLELAAGTYHYDSINISGNAQLRLLGPVTIYVDGEVYVGGNGIATSGNIPANFMLYATGSSAIDIAGTSEFHGAIYAPASEVHYTGTQDFYGAVISKVFNQSGTADLHYDEALKDIPAPCTNVTLLSWRENNTILQSSSL